MKCAARHTSHVTRHTSHVTRHTSHVTSHTSHVTRHTSPGIMHIWNSPQKMPVQRPLPHSVSAFWFETTRVEARGQHLFSTTVFCVMYLRWCSTCAIRTLNPFDFETHCVCAVHSTAAPTPMKQEQSSTSSGTM